MQVEEILALIEKATHFVGKFTDIDPKRWKGNDAPNPNHWDSIDEVAGGVSAETLSAWVQFRFTEAGESHAIKATFKVLEPGTRGGADVIELDGAEQRNADFVIGSREGFENWHFYHRLICEFKFVDSEGVKHDYRFDGDL